MPFAVTALIALLLQAPPRPATLQGHTVRAGAGSPVPHARIVLARVGGSISDYRALVADANGRFTFTDVPPGTYRVHATHDGYLQAEFGRRPAGTSGVPIALAEGQRSPDLELVMTPAGVITGHVLRGAEPLRHAIVRAMKIGYIDGERTWAASDSSTAIQWTLTDDRGEYRMFDLAPGSYLVSAVPRGRPRIEGDVLVTPTMATNANGNQRSERAALTVNTIDAAAFERVAYPTVYYPAANDPALAQPVDVRAGATATGIDLTVIAAEPHHVRGQISLLDATAAVSSVSVALQPADTPFALPLASVRPDGAGAFDVPGVPPGRYYVSAQAQADGVTLSDIVQVEVGEQDPPPVTIALRRGVTIGGRLSIDGHAPVAGAAQMFVQLQPYPAVRARGGCCSAARVNADGTFTLQNVASREYRFRVMPMSGPFWVKSARFGGEDAIAAPIRIPNDLQGRELEIELSTRTASIDVLVNDEEQRPMPGVLVIAVPPAERRNQSSAYRSATTGADGRARLDALAPGEYRLFASEAIAAADWQDPVVVRQYESRGTAATMAEGETRSFTVRIVR
jgi:hypothetical protein